MVNTNSLNRAITVHHFGAKDGYHLTPKNVIPEEYLPFLKKLEEELGVPEGYEYSPYTVMVVNGNVDKQYCLQYGSNNNEHVIKYGDILVNKNLYKLGLEVTNSPIEIDGEIIGYQSYISVEINDEEVTFPVSHMLNRDNKIPTMSQVKRLNPSDYVEIKPGLPQLTNISTLTPENILQEYTILGYSYLSKPGKVSLILNTKEQGDIWGGAFLSEYTIPYIKTDEDLKLKVTNIEVKGGYPSISWEANGVVPDPEWKSKKSLDLDGNDFFQIGKKYQVTGCFFIRTQYGITPILTILDGSSTYNVYSPTSNITNLLECDLVIQPDAPPLFLVFQAINRKNDGKVFASASIITDEGQQLQTYDFANAEELV